MIGLFKINKFIDARTVEASADIDENIVVSLYLQPLNRKDTSQVAAGDKVFAVVDDVSGIGCVMVNLTHDFDHRFDYSIDVKGKITATDDIKAGTVSMQNHIHAATLTVEGTAAAGVVSGAATGNTAAPTA